MSDSRFLAKVSSIDVELGDTEHWREATLYFAAIFLLRVVLRLTCPSETLNWFLSMVIEDGMSIMTFALGLTYLYRTNGHILLRLEERVSPQVGWELSFASDDMWMVAATVRPRKLCHLAM